MSHALQVGVAQLTGDAGAALAALARLRDRLGDRDLVDTERAYIARGEAWGALAEADPPRAQRILLEAAEQLAGIPVYVAQLHYEAMNAGAPARSLVAPLDAARARCDAPLVAAYADHVAARAAGDGPALLAATDRLAAIGTTRYAVNAAAHAAEAFAAAGREDSARNATARCGALHALGQRGLRPAIAGIDSAAVELTPREAQLVELASRGLTNAQIADRLVLSVRTVESHLYRAMRKLGITDRRDLST